MPEDTEGFLACGIQNRQRLVVVLVVVGFFPQLQHSSHGWTQNSGELSREAADQAINAESTKCWAVNEKWSLFLLPEVFVFMVHRLYRVQTRLCPLIRSAHYEVMDHERTINHSILLSKLLFMKPRGWEYQISLQSALSCSLPVDKPHQLLWMDPA